MNALLAKLVLTLLNYAKNLNRVYITWMIVSPVAISALRNIFTVAYKNTTGKILVITVHSTAVYS